MSSNKSCHYPDNKKTNLPVQSPGRSLPLQAYHTLSSLLLPSLSMSHKHGAIVSVCRRCGTGKQGTHPPPFPSLFAKGGLGWLAGLQETCARPQVKRRRKARCGMLSAKNEIRVSKSTWASVGPASEVWTCQVKGRPLSRHCFAVFLLPSRVRSNRQQQGRKGSGLSRSGMPNNYESPLWIPDGFSLDWVQKS